MRPKRLSRKVIYENEWVNLYADEVQYADGTILPEHHVVHFDYEAAAVVVENARGDILLIRSNRYITQTTAWELPAGRVDAGETTDEAAVREVMEETGYRIANLRQIYRYYPTNGISDQRFVLFHAVALEQVGSPDPREVSETRWFSKADIRNMISLNEILCGLSLTGLLLALSAEAND